MSLFISVCIYIYRYTYKIPSVDMYIYIYILYMYPPEVPNHTSSPKKKHLNSDEQLLPGIAARQRSLSTKMCRSSLASTTGNLGKISWHSRKWDPNMG